MTRLPFGRLIAALALLALAVVLAACQETEEEPSPAATDGPTASASGPAPDSSTQPPSQAGCDPNPTPAPETKVWRWGDLTIMIAEGVFVYGDVDRNGTPILVLGSSSARRTIDATTGNVTPSYDPSGLRVQEAEIQAALATISICPFDAATALWPYKGEPSDLPLSTLGIVTYVEPDPASGMQVRGGKACSDGTGAGGCHDFIEVRSARSVLYIDARDGRVMDAPKIQQEEQSAFDRYLSYLETINPR